MGYKKSGFPDFRFNPIGFRRGYGAGVPNQDEALHYSKAPAVDNTFSDRTGASDRTSVMAKKFVGDGSTYIRFADYPSESFVYYDISTEAEVSDTLDADGDFVLPSTGVYYIVVDGHLFVPEEITDPTDSSQTTFYDAGGTVQAQAFLTHAGWVANSVHGEALSDSYGYTEAGILNVCKDPTRYLYYDEGQPVHARRLSDGSYSRLECKGYERLADAGATWDKTTNQTLVRNDTDYTDKAREIFSGITEVTDDLGNVFVRIPKFYIKKVDGAGNKEWYISTEKEDSDFYLPAVFYDFENEAELPYFDYGKHLGAVVDGKLCSKPNLAPTVNTNIVDFRTYAEANGAGYQQLDVHAIDVLRTLWFVEFADIDSQNIIQGATYMAYSESHTITVAETGTNRAIVANATADEFVVGQSISIGTTRGSFSVFGSRKITSIDTYDASNKAMVFDGDAVDLTVGLVVYSAPWQTGWSSPLQTGWLTANNGKYPCAYHGIESPFGDVYQFVDGVNINDWQAWVCKDAREYASNLFASPYEQLSYVNANTSGWLEQTGYDASLPFAEFPVTVGSSGYYDDYYYQNSGARVAHFGGTWLSGSDRGLSLWALGDSSSSAYFLIGSRLLKKPL